MTIYTSTQNEKDKDKEELVPEVAMELLMDETGDDAKEEVEKPVKTMRVTYLHKNRRTFCFHLLLAMAVSLILACGVIGGMIFYRHLRKKAETFSGTCGNVYFDARFHNELDNGQVEAQSDSQRRQILVDGHQMDFIEEGIVVSEDDMYEELHTPAFDEVKESYVLHDFKRNFTSFVDKKISRCYVMKLNRSAIAAPRDLVYILQKHVSGYYLPKSTIIRERYTASYMVTNLDSMGPRFARSCGLFSSFWVERNRYMGDMMSHLLQRNGLEKLMYAMLSNQLNNQVIYKLSIHQSRDPSTPQALP